MYILMIQVYCIILDGHVQLKKIGVDRNILNNTEIRWLPEYAEVTNTLLWWNKYSSNLTESHDLPIKNFHSLYK